MNAIPTLPKRELAEKLAEADLRVLLMVLFHLTGERRWMEPPFQTKRDVKLIADEDAGLPEAIQAEIRAAALEVLSRAEISPEIDDPGDALMVEMMSACLGQAVPPEYAPMMREEMGLISRKVSWSDPSDPPSTPTDPVVIVGAGASGIALGANFETLGIPYVIFERNEEVGGTWLENRYPGCGVDTPNHAYSFSFGTPYPWSRYFAPRDELQDYMEKSATESGVRPHIRFNTRVTGCDWDDGANRWQVSFDGPAGKGEIRALALVSAIGQLSLPAIARFEGDETFQGPLFHTALWPEDLDLAGKRVAIIGTGASAMQIVPTIVDDVAELTVYQRSAQWARPIPRYHDPIGDGAQWLLRHVPYYASWFRFTMLWRYGDGLLPSLRKDPDWPHPERSLNRANDRHRQEMTDHIQAELGDHPDLLDKCLPSYPPYGKRILLDNGWYQAITRGNAELVTDDIARIEPTGIRTSDGTLREADIIVLSTGFKITMAARLNITGPGGRSLTEEWADDRGTAHLGITVPNYPNLFIMQGPNTGLGHGGSAIFQAECQARYITGCVAGMVERGLERMTVKQAEHDAYIARVDAEHETMIWTHPGMSTYYRNADGRVFSVMPWRLVDYWAMTREPDFSEYDCQPA